MSWIDGARARLALLRSAKAAEARFSEEIGFHIHMETERLRRDEGLDAGEARRRALATFGGVVDHKEALHDGRGLRWVGGLSLDLRLGLRMMAKHPGLSLVSVLGMALAIAIGAIVFGSVAAVLDRQPICVRMIAPRSLPRRSTSSPAQGCLRHSSRRLSSHCTSRDWACRTRHAVGSIATDLISYVRTTRQGLRDELSMVRIRTVKRA